jgi:hypothetical protein
MPSCVVVDCASVAFIASWLACHRRHRQHRITEAVRRMLRRPRCREPTIRTAHSRRRRRRRRIIRPQAHRPMRRWHHLRRALRCLTRRLLSRPRAVATCRRQCHRYYRSLRTQSLRQRLGRTLVPPRRRRMLAPHRLLARTTRAHLRCHRLALTLRLATMRHQ